MPNATLAAVLVLALAVGACGTTGPTATPASATPPPPGSAAPPTSTGTGALASVPAPASAAATSPSPGSSASPGSGAERPDLAAARVAVVPYVNGLDTPLWVTGAGDGSARLFVAEQPGRIRVIRDGQEVAKPFLDITDRVLAGGERGLLGVAFPPGFGATRPLVFVHYSNRDGDTTVSEFRLNPHDLDALDASSERILLAVKQPYPNHNGGWIGFDPDGMLLVALGDGGSGGDPENRASNPDELLGKILRLDVLGAPGDAGYGIPADNPFAAGGGRAEILHSGLRNPFRASIDPATGSLWIGDVGQDLWEEVDVAPAGARGLDFGWRRWEGRHCYNPDTGCAPDGVTMPVTEYPHGPGCSVIGGVVYRGAAIPALRGAYLFSDYCSGTVWALDAGLAAAQAPVTIAETGRQVSSIGTGDDGEVYLTDLGGELLRLVPGG